MEVVFKTAKGNAATDTVKVAAKFGKQHKHIMRDVRTILAHRAENQAEVSQSKSGPRESVAIFHLYGYIDSRGKEQEMYLMNRAAFTLLVLGFKGKKAAAFKEEYVAEFDRMETVLRLQANASPVAELEQHTHREVQVGNSKGINEYQFEQGGIQAVMIYNRRNCELHTGKRPSVLKRDAKSAGLPYKQRTSGKEVTRHTDPAAACSMSLADSFVRRGATLEQVAQFTIPATAVFAGMLALGIRPAELGQ